MASRPRSPPPRESRSPASGGWWRGREPSSKRTTEPCDPWRADSATGPDPPRCRVPGREGVAVVIRALLNMVRLSPVAIASTIWHGIRIVWVARRTRLDRDPRLVDLPRSWTDSLLWAGGVRVRMEGLENLVEPAVLVCNHVSCYDVFALVSNLPVDARFVGKKEIVKIPFFGPAWVASGHIPI